MNEEMYTEKGTAVFAEKIVTRQFGELFYPMHEETIKKIWSDSSNHRLLDNVLDDNSVSDEAKFLSCTVGITFLAIGRKAIPALFKLLDDERTNLKYQGSEEATVGNAYGYRIKDFAAYYIGRILGSPLKYYSDLAERDEQINRLKATLAKR